MEIKLETKLTIKSLLVTKATFKHQLKILDRYYLLKAKKNRY